MATVSQKLSNSLEGALAGGGDPATSPLYVFGPFLRLIVVAGVAAVTFGTSIWLVVFTIAMVSAMYRLVMSWVTDGSGGSGLSEEEFGGWAVKVNAAITFIEYTLTFLVSMAAMVTFIADRLPVLNESILGIQYRTLVAIALSILTGWLVNRGPKTAARAFGPATAGVLLLLWAMVISTIWNMGFNLPDFNLAAFSGEYLHFTFGGFTRMLAVMTGIEVFANLVAAYDGTEQQKSRKAFGSLLIIMGTTVATMLIVGPAIYSIAEPTNEHVSVFTQTMDALLPQPVAYLGTLIGIAVLLSASAASAQGLQNLALGLWDRNYIPAFLGQKNEFGVADKPVWLEVGLVVFIFLLAGTNEETYLAIYAAGVFILLSMTGWAACKRLVRQLRSSFAASRMALLLGTGIAALLTSAATIVIFEERFLEGAWMYFVFIPLLYVGFTSVRNRLGAPSPAMRRLAQLEATMGGGFGYGQAFERGSLVLATGTQNPIPAVATGLVAGGNPPMGVPRHILVSLDGSKFSEQAIPAAEKLAQVYGARLTVASVVRDGDKADDKPADKVDVQAYLDQLAAGLAAGGLEVATAVRQGPVPKAVNEMISEFGIDLVVISTRGRGGLQRMLMGSVANKLVQSISQPILLIRPVAGDVPPVPRFNKLLVTLDGSEFAERVLPYARASARMESEVLLLSVPQVPDARLYGAVVEEIQRLREQAEVEACDYLTKVADSLSQAGVQARVIVKGDRPAETIVSVAEEEGVDVVMLATHGLGGFDRLFVGSVADRVVQKTRCPVFLVPIRERRQW